MVVVLVSIGAVVGWMLAGYYAAETHTVTEYSGVTHYTTETTTTTQRVGGPSSNAFEIELDYEFIGNATLRMNITELVEWALDPKHTNIPVDQFLNIRADEIRWKIRVSADNIDQIIQALRSYGYVGVSDN